MRYVSFLVFFFIFTISNPTWAGSGPVTGDVYKRQLEIEAAQRAYYEARMTFGE